MGYSYFIPSSVIPILIIICSLLIPIAFSIGDTELGHICAPNTKPFTIAYNQSRALAVMDLIINTASSDGFRNASYAWPDRRDPAYGLALCRGDVSPDACKTCVNNATLTLIYTHCPYSRAAIIWHDYCFLKYSDFRFFGTIDTDNEFSSMSNSTWHRIESPDNKVRNFMMKLSKTATQSPKFYAHGIPDIHTMEDTLYGVAQCTRDLSKDDCKKCLESAVNNLKVHYKGGRIVYGSCNVRYETLLFPQLLTNPPTTNYKSVLNNYI